MTRYQPDISVVIPTHNRQALLIMALEALAAQSLSPDRFEVIVVMDAVTDGSEAAMSTRPWPFALRILKHAMRSEAATRNAGAALARAAWVVFLDDDVRAEPTCLQAHLQAADNDPNRIVLGPYWPDIPQRSWFHDGIRTWWRARFTDMADPGWRFSHTDLATGNVSMSHALFKRLGGFSTDLVGAREDYEFGYRAMLEGVSLVYSAEASALHRDQSDSAKNLRRIGAEGKNDIIIARRYPELFPVMAVSWLSEAGPAPWLLRQLTFGWPRAIGPVLTSIDRVLPSLERLGQRRVWDVFARWRWRLAYYSRTAAEVGSISQLHAMRDRGFEAWTPRILDVDLFDGIDVAGAALDAARPEGCNIHVGPRRIGRLPPLPGRERLGRKHLEAWLRSQPLYWSAEVAAAGRLPSLPAKDVDASKTMEWAWSVGEFDILTSDLRSLKGSFAFPMMTLVRAGPISLGYVYLAREAALGGVLLSLRRQALADWSICRGLLRATIYSPVPAIAPPPFSVVVCTHDRTETLVDCLEALRALEYPSYEIIVVDSAPTTDATARLVASIPGVSYVREDRLGLNRARNRGLAAAQQDLVAFIDDDAMADRHWLSEMARAFEDPQVAAVTGLVAPMELASEAQRHFEFDLGGMCGWFRSRLWSMTIDGPRGILWARFCGSGANMAVRKAMMARIGSFDPAIGLGTPTRGGDDIEMFHRLLSQGGDLFYTPDAVVWHRHRSNWDGLGRRMSASGSGFAAYLIAAWRGRTVPRHLILRFAARDWIGPTFKRLLRPGSHRRAMVLREIGGMLRGPEMARRARRQAVDLAAPPVALGAPAKPITAP